MNPLTYISNMTSADVQRYARIILQWIAAGLVTHGVVTSNATWIEPAIGVGVGIISLFWTLYGNRIQAKINEIAKLDAVKTVQVTDKALADNAPDNVVKVTK